MGPIKNPLESKFLFQQAINPFRFRLKILSCLLWVVIPILIHFQRLCYTVWVCPPHAGHQVVVYKIIQFLRPLLRFFGSVLCMGSSYVVIWRKLEITVYKSLQNFLHVFQPPGVPFPHVSGQKAKILEVSCTIMYIHHKLHRL